MSNNLTLVNENTTVAGIAPLNNMLLLEQITQKVQDRPDHLPGIATFSGPSGFGKSTAAAWVSAKFDANYLEIRSTWTKKAFLQALAREQGLQPRNTVYEISDQVSEELACTQRPLILDEFDHAIERNLVELVRDIYEQSKAPIILIGEERLPHKLQKWERFHGRIMDFQQAQPASVDDARTLLEFFHPGVEVKNDLMNLLVGQARGSVRRIVTNLDRIAHFYRGEGQPIGIKEWGDQPLHTSKAPAARKF